MKKLILPLLFSTIFALQGLTQPPSPNAPDKQKVEAMKVGFITNNLELTAEEAKVFWPIYNQYEAEKKAARQETMGDKEDKKPFEEMTDAEAQKMIENHIAMKAKDLDITKKYIVEFKKILPIKKVAKLLTLDEHFKRMLLDKAKENPQSTKPPKPPVKQ